MIYDLRKPWETLDPWQEEVLKSTSMYLCIISGRQCGKSTVVSILAAETAINSPGEFIIIGAHVIEQAEILFRKIKAYMEAKHQKEIKKATLQFMELKNGSIIICIPIGDAGSSMRGYTATMIIIDEAALIHDRAWEAIEPIISVTKGKVILLSTPQSKKGFFYKAFINEDYQNFHISARDCPRHTKEFLDRKESEMSPVAFGQEYLGEFLDDYNRKFTEEWIKKVCIINKEEIKLSESADYFLGIDVGGGVGLGETTFEGFDGTSRENVFQVLNIFSNTIAGPDIERQIIKLKAQYNYDRNTIGFDSRGEGSGTYKYLLENDDLKRCMVALDNATRPIGVDGEKTKLLKEFMYDVVEEMGWRGELKCFNEGAVKQSFESIQVTIKSNGERSYSGSYDHIVDGVVEAIWLIKDKPLNPYIN